MRGTACIIRRGTTPVHNFAVNMDLTDATIYVTYTQQKVLIEKTGEDLKVSPYNIEVHLSQEDTLSFVAGRSVNAQIRYVSSDGSADASNIFTLEVEDVLKDGVIAHVNSEPEPDPEPSPEPEPDPEPEEEDEEEQQPPDQGGDTEG